MREADSAPPGVWAGALRCCWAQKRCTWKPRYAQPRGSPLTQAHTADWCLSLVPYLGGHPVVPEAALLGACTRPLGDDGRHPVRTLPAWTPGPSGKFLNYPNRSPKIPTGYGIGLRLVRALLRLSVEPLSSPPRALSSTRRASIGACWSELTWPRARQCGRASDHRDHGTDWAGFLALPFAGCVSLGGSFHFSGLLCG